MKVMGDFDLIPVTCEVKVIVSERSRDGVLIADLHGSRHSIPKPTCTANPANLTFKLT